MSDSLNLMHDGIGNNNRCGKCPACLCVERARQLALKCANPPFSHATDEVVMLWNDALEANPCETWITEDAEV